MIILTLPIKQNDSSDDEMLDKTSKQAMDLHPTGHTLATTQVVCFDIIN